MQVGAGRDVMQAYLEACGGDPQRAMEAMSDRLVWFANLSNGGFLKRNVNLYFTDDVEKLARETDALTAPLPPIDESMAR